MDPFELGYCIGLIVGEGCFAWHHKAKQIVCLRVHLHMEDPEPLDALQRCFGGKLYGPYHSNGRHFLCWVLVGTALKTAAPVLFQHMPVCKKRRQMEAIWEAAGYAAS